MLHTQYTWESKFSPDSTDSKFSTDTCLMCQHPGRIVMFNYTANTNNLCGCSCNTEFGVVDKHLDTFKCSTWACRKTSSGKGNLTKNNTRKLLEKIRKKQHRKLSDKLPVFPVCIITRMLLITLVLQKDEWDENFVLIKNYKRSYWNALALQSSEADVNIQLWDALGLLLA